MKATNRIYDAFVKNDSCDLEMVRRVVSGLRIYGLHLWFSETSIVTDPESADHATDGLSKSRSIVIFVGKNGLSRDEGLPVSSGLPTIVVFLPGVQKDAQSVRSLM